MDNCEEYPPTARTLYPRFFKEKPKKRTAARLSRLFGAGCLVRAVVVLPLTAILRPYVASWSDVQNQADMAGRYMYV